jgi:hypothetical protein
MRRDDLNRSRKVAFVLALCLAATLQGVASAQEVQVGDNVNVLPVVRTDDPSNDYLRGDLYGQRQGEPDIAFSSLNPDHAMAIYNDFRAVDVPADPSLPDFNSSAIARLWSGARTLLARVLGRTGPKPAPGPPVAALEAGIGMSVTYDGGMTWTGGFMPGLPFDDSQASRVSPARLEGMSDPVLLSAPCGRFYAFYLAFTRGGQSKLMLARFQDLNNDELNHTIKFLGFTEIDSGQNDTNGHFLDKPSGAIIPTGATSCEAVTEHLVFVYTTFTGNGSGGKFQSRLNYARSVDGGRTFSISGIDKDFTQNQGNSVVVNPVTRQVVVFWRSFNSPHTIVMRRQQSNGNWANPVDILANDALKTLANFDQTTVSTSGVPVGSGPDALKNELAFRANAFPVAAFSPDGSSLIVTWHEKVDPVTGLPSPAGSPRIVWKYSTDGGATWSQRRAIAMDHRASPPGLGHFNPAAQATGPQLLPSVACAAGTPNRCLLSYYESRPYAPANPATGLSANGWVGGYDRVLDLRGVLIDARSTPVVNPSFQVSRYSYRPLLKNETPQETLDYVEPICQPDGTNCYPGLNYSGRPHTGGGTSPFMHDYTSVKPIVQWIKDKASGTWRIAKDAADVPFAAGFGLAWADNRNIVEPMAGAPGGAAWQNYGNYGPAGLGGSCVNPGSRNQDVMFTRVSLGLLLTAATNYKPFPGGTEPIEFPMTVWNNTGQDRQFELAITSGNGSFAKEDVGTYAFPLRDGGVTIFAYSSASIDVYAFDGNPVTVSVKECAVGTCTAVANPLTGSMTFNSPGAAPPAGAPSPTYRSADIVASPVPRNPVPRNPVPRNPVPKNPVPRNPVPGEPDVYDVITYSWNVTPTSQDDAGAYLALTNIDKAYQNDYVFQVFVTKPTTRYAVNGCEPGNELQGSLVGHISELGNPVPRNPVPRNPVPRNPVPRNAPLSDVLVQNTTFTLESSETASAPDTASFSALAATSLGCDPVTGAGLIGECTLAAPRPANQATITVVAYQITPDPAVKFDPYGDKTGTANPPSVVVADYWCTSAAEGCAFAQDGPDLAVPDPPSANVAPTRVRAGQAVTFPLEMVRVDNRGTQTAGPHRFGIYLSTAASASETELPRNPDGTIKENPNGPGVVTRLVDFGDLGAVLAGGSEDVGSKVITVPTDIPLLNPDGTGTYYLYLYVDDRRRVNEIDEDNNIVQGGPIAVDPAGYRMLGLYTPCSGLTCKKKTGSSFPLAFGLAFDGVAAVDSQSTPPVFKVYAPVGTACQTDLAGSSPLFTADPNDVSSGGSGWQYFTVAGTRPAFTWQYNFQGKNPTTGAILPIGCYSFVLEVPATDQKVGSLLGPVTRLSITLTK